MSEKTNFYFDDNNQTESTKIGNQTTFTTEVAYYDNWLCSGGKYRFALTVFTSIGTLSAVIILQLIFLLYMCVRRFRKIKNEKATKKFKAEDYDDFRCYLLAFTYQLKKEGGLKGDKKYTTKEAVDALRDDSFSTLADEIKADVSRYFSLNNSLVEGPYFGFRAPSSVNSHFTQEEHKHRKGLTDAKKATTPIVSGKKADDSAESVYEPIFKKSVSKKSVAPKSKSVKVSVKSQSIKMLGTSGKSGKK